MITQQGSGQSGLEKIWKWQLKSSVMSVKWLWYCAQFMQALLLALKCYAALTPVGNACTKVADVTAEVRRVCDNVVLKTQHNYSIVSQIIRQKTYFLGLGGRVCDLSFHVHNYKVFCTTQISSVTTSRVMTCSEMLVMVSRPTGLMSIRPLYSVLSVLYLMSIPCNLYILSLGCVLRLPLFI